MGALHRLLARGLQVEPLLRPIRAEDDSAIAAIIREVMTEFGAVGAGYSIEDSEVAAMSAAYPAPRSAYLVVEMDGRVLGGGGIGPLWGGPEDVCELRKMYFLPEVRGLGAGRRVVAELISFAQRAGYSSCYLETLKHMDAARALYKSFGFEPIDGPLGATGHFGCDAWYVLGL